MSTFSYSAFDSEIRGANSCNCYLITPWQFWEIHFTPIAWIICWFWWHLKIEVLRICVEPLCGYQWYPVWLLCSLCISPFQDFHSGYPGRVPPNQSEQRLQPAVVTGTELTPEPLYFEVREGFFSMQHCYHHTHDRFILEFICCAKMFSTCLSGWRWVPRPCYWRGCPTQHQTRICSSPGTHAT